MAQIDLRNATIVLKDNGANSLEVKIGEGSLDYSEKRNIELVLSRGELDTTREENEEGMEVSFSFIWEYIESPSGQPITIEDALKRRNAAVAWATTSTDAAAPFCLDLHLTYIPPCGTSGLSELIVFPQYNFKELAHSLKDGTIACSGICNALEPIVSHF